MRDFAYDCEVVRLEAERIYTNSIPTEVKECVLKADFDTRYAFIAISGYYDDNSKQYIDGLMDQAAAAIPFYSVYELLDYIYRCLLEKRETAKGDKLNYICDLLSACDYLLSFLSQVEMEE